MQQAHPADEQQQPVLPAAAAQPRQQAAAAPVRGQQQAAEQLTQQPAAQQQQQPVQQELQLQQPEPAAGAPPAALEPCSLSDGIKSEGAYYADQQARMLSRRPNITGNGDPQPQPAGSSAWTLSPIKRPRKASRKQQESAESDALQAALAAKERAARQAAGGRQRAGLRRGGMGGMTGFGASAHRGPAHQPMPLLPGEQPLAVERHFGEGRPLKPNGRLGLPPDGAGEGRALPVPERCAAAVQRARRLLSERMRRQGAGDEEVASMLSLLREFEAKCLAGSEAVTPADAKRMCTELDRRLRLVYNRPGHAPLVLDAHVMSGAALKDQAGQDDLQHMRVAERRFIIWTPPDLPPEAVQAAGAPSARAAAAAAAGGAAAAAEAAAAGGSPGGAWDRGLGGIWNEFSSRLQGKKYGDIGLSSVSHNVSCALNDTEWKDGHLKRVGMKQTAPVMSQVERCQRGERQGRLYVTDGSMPDYEVQQYPRDAPGMPCGVDAAANAMLPPAVRSSRATNLFHAIKNESTGTKTFTLFGPAGGGTNLTAFHFETKRRRSYNLGTGDFIIQPLATQEAMRQVMRVHAAVAGRHTRHGQLLPLEVYLEEGVPLVLHMRDYRFATLCELCEQSMHAFISCSTVACSPPALKVSCNDCDLLWELDSCYWLEKLACLYSDLRTFPEEGLPPDGADQWVMSSYLLKKPHTLLQKQGGWERPWLCEAQGQAAHAALAAGEELQEGDMHWSVDIMAVRCVEKVLDVLNGKLAQPAAWAGDLPSPDVAAAVLRRARPVLLDMLARAVSEHGGASHAAVDGSALEFEFSPRWPVECHFSREYVEDLLEEVNDALARSSGSGGGGGTAGGAPAAKRPRHASPPHPAQAPAGLLPCLLTSDAHAEYAKQLSMHGRQATQLVRQADAMLEASAAARGGGSDGASAPAVPALAEQPLPVLRSHWLLRLQLEWQAAADEPLDLERLALRRRQRSEVESLLDAACRRLAEQHQQDWGVLAGAGA